jgi:hypothetical protein
MGAPPNLVEHQEPAVAVEPLERLDPASIGARSGENTRRGRPRLRQAIIVTKIAARIATPCAVLIQSIMPAGPGQLEMRAVQERLLAVAPQAATCSATLSLGDATPSDK